MSTSFVQKWEGYWRGAPPEPRTVFWDAEPDLVARRHLPLLTPYFGERLPLVDLGCGNGTQTAFFAGHFRPVVGIDFSTAAIELAQRRPDIDGVDFRHGDAADPRMARLLHDEFGDCHIYLRGVLHQSLPEDRARIAESVATLTGERGRAFDTEPAAAAKDVLMELMRRPEGPPPTLAAVFEHGIAPTELPDDALPDVYRAAGLEVLASGELPLATTETTADGSRVELPSRWLVAGRNG